MFESFFGLSENPFNLTPDPKFLFLSKAHEEALSHLKYGIERRKGFVMISGEVGAGKTTICRALLASLPSTVRTALILNPSLSDIELLQTINQEFGINAAHASKKALLDELYEFLINVFVRGENAVLIIDECQNLSPDVLEQIRMLSNLETEKEKLLQIVLVGQPELVKLLSSPSMKQINDRIVLRYHIWPLSLTDTRNYIHHRLIVSGSHGNVLFTKPAFRRIYRYSEGIPRRINAVVERSMLICYLRSTKKVTAGIVDLAIKELEGNYSPRKFNPLILIPTACAAGILALGLFWPSLLTDLADRVRLWDKAAERQVVQPAQAVAIAPPKTQSSPIQSPAPDSRNISDRAIRDYSEAVEILGQLPEGIRGPDALNLHPHPDYLKHVPQPSIVSVEGGYLVLLKVDTSFVRVVGSSRAIVEIPVEEFKKIYKWNVILAYSRPLHPEAPYTLNMTGQEVLNIQEALVSMGLLSISPNGVFGVETAQAVEKFQEIFGLKRDGIAGPETATLLRSINKDKDVQ
jgi:general secretion pathway protein A